TAVRKYRFLQRCDRFFDSPYAFFEALERRRVADADEVVRAERAARHHRDARLFEQERRERLRIDDVAFPEELAHFGEHVKRSVGIGAAEAVDGIDRGNEPRATLAIRVVHATNLGVVAAQRGERGGLRDRARIRSRMTLNLSVRGDQIRMRDRVGVATDWKRVVRTE